MGVGTLFYAIFRDTGESCEPALYLFPTLTVLGTGWIPEAFFRHIYLMTSYN
jgi:hypothetical protein